MFAAISQPNRQARKTWERFREIPKWIIQEAESRTVPPSQIMQELERMREENPARLGLRALTDRLKVLRIALKVIVSYLCLKPAC